MSYLGCGQKKPSLQKTEGVSKWADREKRKKKKKPPQKTQEYFRILTMRQYLNPASCFTLLDLSFIGKDAMLFQGLAWQHCTITYAFVSF